MRIHWILAFILIAPVPVQGQKQCPELSDPTFTRQIIPPPLGGIHKVVVETTTGDSVDRYSALTKLGEWHVRMRGLEVVDSLNQADAMLHIELWPSAMDARTAVVVSWERSYRNAAGQIHKTPVFSYAFEMPTPPSSIDLQREVENAFFLVLSEREWQSCTT